MQNNNNKKGMLFCQVSGPWGKSVLFTLKVIPGDKHRDMAVGDSLWAASGYLGALIYCFLQEIATQYDRIWTQII